MVKGVMTPKSHVMSELKKYAVYALSNLDKALELHFKNPFRKWRFKKHIYKQKTFVKILQRITTKKSELDKKHLIVGFGNWGNPRDSIILGHQRGPVEEESCRSGVRWWMSMSFVHPSYAAIVIVKWQR